MTRPTILLVSTALPCRHGTGSEIRAFFLLQSASLVGNVTLVLPGSVSEAQKAHFDYLCVEVIGAPGAGDSRRQTQSRLKSWGRLLSVLLSPWQQQMQPFIHLCSQFTLAGRLSGHRRIFGWMLFVYQLLLSRVFGMLPMAVVWQKSSLAAISSGLERAITANPAGFDLIWLETTAGFACLEQIMERMRSNIPVVLSAHNIEWMIPKRQAADIRDPLLRFATLLQADLMHQFERRAHRASDLAIHCSANDAELAKEFNARTRIVCVGNGVDIEHYRPSPNNASDVPLIIYTGNFDYQPNIDAARRLVIDVLPLIHKQIQEARLLIAGRNAAALADKLPGGLAWLTTVSNPDDMRPLLEQAWITVIPLRSGSGTRLKILEAMAMKVAVISTAIGAEGLEATDGDVLLIRDSAEAQAEAAVRLLQDAHARGELAERACKWVGERFSWERLVQQTVDEVRPLVSSH